jgi:predicted Zn-dependent protease with MMP-like domain
MTRDEGAHPSFTTPPSRADIEAMAERALASIPAPLRRRIDNVAIAVDELADDATLREMGIESAWDLTGLYRGTPLHLRHSGQVAREPDLISLYRQPILLEWIDNDEDLYRLVRNVLVHEIAHHFGFSDAEIDALEADDE